VSTAASGDGEVETHRVIRGRRWRVSDPRIPEELRQALVDELMSARRAVKAADEPTAERAARDRVHDAKVALGERGVAWWEDGPDPDEVADRIRRAARAIGRARSDLATDTGAAAAAVAAITSCPREQVVAILDAAGDVDDTTARVEAATIGPVEPGRIVLADPDPQWPARAEERAEVIRAALGEAALEVHHVGSTSVPGLPAKPILDLLLVVPDPADEDAYVPVLEARGYALRIREPGWYEHRVLRTVGDLGTNLHVFGPGCPEVARMLAFRDHLRTDDADRERYAAAKRHLAAREWPTVQHYADAKSAVVAEILGSAARSGQGR
jgi:GrpB-like predicted nucleotidyltransferase (UPF0157 family)